MWGVGLTPKFPMKLDVQQAGGNMNLNLADLLIKSLRVKAGSGTLSLKVPTRTFSADIAQETGDTEISLPANTGLQIKVNKLRMGTLIIGGKDAASGLNLSGTYQTDNFNSAKNRVTVTITKDLGSVRVKLP